MNHFSEESLLIIRNWDAYQDIRKAGERLKTEVNSVRSAIAGRLRKQAWWNARWVLYKDDPDFLSFTDGRWEAEDDHLIWVGVEGFNPDSLFADGSAPSMYVWITGKRPELKAELQRIIKAGANPAMGDLSSSKDGYVVKKNLSKCLPEQIDKLEDMLFSPLAEFCEFYTRLFDEFDKAAQKHLKR